MAGQTVTLTLEVLSDRFVAGFRPVTTQLDRFDRQVKQLAQSSQASNQAFDRFGDALARLPGPLGAVGAGIARMRETLMGPLGLVAGLAGIGVGIGAAVRSATALGQSLHVLAIQSGVSVETLSGLRLAAAQADLSMEDLGASLKFLQKSISDAGRGNKELIQLFNDLGVPVRDSRGAFRSVEAVLADVAVGIGQLDSESDKTASTLLLLGRAGQGTREFLEDLRAKGLSPTIEEARRLGLVMSTEAAKAADQFGDTLTKVGLLVKALVTPLGQALIPALTTMAESFATGLSAVRTFGASLVTLAGQIPGLTTALTGLSTAAGTLFAVLAGAAALKGVALLWTTFQTAGLAALAVLAAHPVMALLLAGTMVITIAFKVLSAQPSGATLQEDARKIAEEIQRITASLATDLDETARDRLQLRLQQLVRDLAEVQRQITETLGKAEAGGAGAAPPPTRQLSNAQAILNSVLPAFDQLNLKFEAGRIGIGTYLQGLQGLIAQLRATRGPTDETRLAVLKLEGAFSKGLFGQDSGAMADAEDFAKALDLVGARLAGQQTLLGQAQAALAELDRRFEVGADSPMRYEQNLEALITGLRGVADAGPDVLKFLEALQAKLDASNRTRFAAPMALESPEDLAAALDLTKDTQRLIEEVVAQSQSRQLALLSQNIEARKQLLLAGWLPANLQVETSILQLKELFARDALKIEADAEFQREKIRAAGLERIAALEEERVDFSRRQLDAWLRINVATAKLAGDAWMVFAASFERGMLDATDSLKALEQAALDIAAALKTNLSDALFSGLTGQFDGITRAFDSMLHTMLKSLTDFLASDILKQLKGWFDEFSTGFGAGVAGQTVGGMESTVGGSSALASTSQTAQMGAAIGGWVKSVVGSSEAFEDIGKKVAGVAAGIAIGEGILQLVLGPQKANQVAAQVGAAVGGAIGAAIGTWVFPALGTAGGAAIGSTAGGLIGSLFGGDTHQRITGIIQGVLERAFEKFAASVPNALDLFKGILDPLALAFAIQAKNIVANVNAAATALGGGDTGGGPADPFGGSSGVGIGSAAGNAFAEQLKTKTAAAIQQGVTIGFAKLRVEDFERFFKPVLEITQKLIGDALKAGLLEPTVTQGLATFRQRLMTSVLDAIVTALSQSSVFQAALAPLIAALTSAVQQGLAGQALQATLQPFLQFFIDEFNALTPVFEQLFGIFQSLRDQTIAGTGTAPAIAAPTGPPPPDLGQTASAALQLSASIQQVTLASRAWDRSVLQLQGDLGLMTTRMAMLETTLADASLSAADQITALQELTTLAQAYYQTQLDLAQALHDEVLRLTQAINSTLDSITSFTVAFHTSDAALTSFALSLYTASIQATDAAVAVTLWGDLLATVMAAAQQAAQGLSQIPLADFATAVTHLAAQIPLLIGQIQSQFARDPESQLTLLQAMASALQSSLQSALQAVSTYYDRLKAAAQAASQAAISALQTQRAAVQTAFDAQIQATQTMLQTAQDWLKIAEDLKTTLLDLQLGNLAPPSPMAAFGVAQNAFQSAYAAFQAAPTTALATQVSDLGQKLLQVASQVFTRPSPQYAALFAMVTGVLDTVQQFAAAQSTTVPELLADLKTLQADAVAQLAAIDARIQAAQTGLTAALAQLDADEQTALASVQEGFAQQFDVIRAAMIGALAQLVEQRAAADAALHALIGEGNTYQQYIAEQQRAQVAGLAQLHRDLVTILQGLGLPSFQGGTHYVPWTGPAVLHRGEMVVPSGEAAAIRAGQSSRGGGGAGPVTIHMTVNGVSDPEEAAALAVRKIEYSARYGRLSRIIKGEPG